jgi:electron transport complex protein RnfB
VADKKTRRELLADGARVGGVLLVGGLLGRLSATASAKTTVWQIDPQKCIKCGRCAKNCVLTPSAVKCIHAYELCGFCKLCFGMFRDKRTGDELTAENMRCPTDAVKRTFVEDPYYQILVDEPLCIGCGVCVKGCNQFGNGSLYLQIRHDRCQNCNECAIARDCPAEAISRVPIDQPYKIKRGKG